MHSSQSFPVRDGKSVLFTLVLITNSGTSETRTFELVKAHTSFQMKHLHSTSTDSTHVEMVVPVYDAMVWEVDTLVGSFIEKFSTDRHITLNLILVYR